MRQYRVTGEGVVLQQDDSPFPGDRLDAGLVAADHLSSHVEAFLLPQGESVGILVSYSCHCWTSSHEETAHAGMLRFADGTRDRVFDAARFEASRALPELMRGLMGHRIYLTASDRNYGCYNASVIDADGLAYTAFFTLKAGKGRFDGRRHKLVLRVESAYLCTQPQLGMRASFVAVLSAALKGRMLKYVR